MKTILFLIDLVLMLKKTRGRSLILGGVGVVEFEI